MRPGPANTSSAPAVAPALLLDVMTPSGDVYYWADRTLTGVPVAIASPTTEPFVYLPWILSAGDFTLNRSLNTDTGTITLQNVSGDALYRDWERVARRGVLEGSLYVFRYWSVAQEFAWLEQHGTLTVGDSPAGGQVQLNLTQLLSGQDDTPVQTVSETCQINWAEARCGATGTVECNYTYASCQVPEHFVGIQTAFEVNNPETTANVPTATINRRRSW